MPRFPFVPFLLLVIIMASCASGPPPQITPAPSVPLGREAIVDVSLDEAIYLAGRWRYRQVEFFTEQMAQPGFDDSQWAEVDAPATWAAQGLGALTGESALVVYRRQVEVPVAWQGKSVGISAWFNPYASQVFVNGARIEPARKPFAPYADVSTWLRYGEPNTIVVTTLYDGIFEAAETGPPRIGLLTERLVTRVLHEDVTISTEEGDADATIIRPAARHDLPGLILIATGAHGLPEKTTWFDLADDLARQGYFCLALALPVQRPSGVIAAVDYMRSQPWIDPERIVLFGADEGARTAVLAATQDTRIRGVILLSAPQVDEVADLGSRPILLMASRKDRHGFVLEQAQNMAQQVQGPHQVVALPGDGHGTFVFTNAWNAARQALLKWLAEYLPVRR